MGHQWKTRRKLCREGQAHVRQCAAGETGSTDVRWGRTEFTQRHRRPRFCCQEALRLQACKLPYLCSRAVLHSWQKGDLGRKRRVRGGSSSPHISSRRWLRAIICPKVGRAALGLLSAWQCCLTRSTDLVYSHRWFLDPMASSCAEESTCRSEH